MFEYNEKRIFIINGKGGSGKDTFVNTVDKYVPSDNFSSIETIKYIAELLGWRRGKTDKDRKFLSDLKKLSSDYNDLPFQDIMNYTNWFLTSMHSENELLFIHIREPKEIEKMVYFCKENHIKVNTVFVHNSELNGKTYGNSADDGVNDYSYDYYINNSGSLEDLDLSVREFIKFFEIRPFIRIGEEDIDNED